MFKLRSKIISVAKNDTHTISKVSVKNMSKPSVKTSKVNDTDASIKDESPNLVSDIKAKQEDAINADKDIHKKFFRRKPSINQSMVSEENSHKKSTDILKKMMTNSKKLSTLPLHTNKFKLSGNDMNTNDNIRSISDIEENNNSGFYRANKSHFKNNPQSSPSSKRKKLKRFVFKSHKHNHSDTNVRIIKSNIPLNIPQAPDDLLVVPQYLLAEDWNCIYKAIVPSDTDAPIKKPINIDLTEQIIPETNSFAEDLSVLDNTLKELNEVVQATNINDDDRVTDKEIDNLDTMFQQALHDMDLKEHNHISEETSRTDDSLKDAKKAKEVITPDSTDIQTTKNELLTDIYDMFKVTDEQLIDDTPDYYKIEETTKQSPFLTKEEIDALLNGNFADDTQDIGTVDTKQNTEDADIAHNTTQEPISDDFFNMMNDLYSIEITDTEDDNIDNSEHDAILNNADISNNDSPEITAQDQELHERDIRIESSEVSFHNNVLFNINDIPTKAEHLNRLGFIENREDDTNVIK